MNKAYFNDDFLRILRTPGKNISITKFGLFRAPDSTDKLQETVSKFTNGIGAMKDLESIWYPSKNILSITIEIPWEKYKEELSKNNGFDVDKEKYMVALYYKLFYDNTVKTEPGIVIYNTDDKGSIVSPDLLFYEDGLNFYSIQFPSDIAANIIVKDHNLESKTLGISGANLLKDTKEFKNTEFTTLSSYHKYSRRKISAGNTDPIYLDDSGRKILTKKPDFFKYYTRVELSTSNYKKLEDTDHTWNSYFVSDDSNSMVIAGTQYYKLYKYNKQKSEYELLSDKLYSEGITTDVKLNETGEGVSNYSIDLNRTVTFSFNGDSIDTAVIKILPEKTFKNEITGKMISVKDVTGVKVSKFVKWQVWNDTVYNTTISDTIYPLFLLDSDGESEGHYYLETTKLLGKSKEQFENNSNVAFSNESIWNKYFTITEEFTKTSEADGIIQLKITVKSKKKNEGNTWFPLNQFGKSELILCTVDLGVTVINFYVVQRMKPKPISLYYTKTISTDSNQIYGKATEPVKDTDGNYKITLPGVHGYKSMIFTVTDSLSNSVYGNWTLRENTTKTTYSEISDNVFVENSGNSIIHKESEEQSGRGYINTFLYPSNEKDSVNKEQSLGYFTISRAKTDSTSKTETWQDAMYCDPENDIRVNIYLGPEENFSSKFFVRSDTPYFESDSSNNSVYNRLFLFPWGNYKEGSSVTGYTPAASRYFYVFHSLDSTTFALDSVDYPGTSVIEDPSKHITSGKDLDSEYSDYNTDFFRIELVPKYCNQNNYWIGGAEVDKSGKYKYTQDLKPIVLKFKATDSKGETVDTFSVSIYCVIGVNSPKIEIYTDGDLSFKEIDKINNPTYTVEKINSEILKYLKSGDTITNGIDYYEVVSDNYKKIDDKLFLFNGDEDGLSFKYEKNLYITSDKTDSYNYWISDSSSLSREVLLSKNSGEISDKPKLKDGVYNFTSGAPVPVVIGSEQKPESVGINFGNLEISRYSEEGNNTSLVKSDWRYAAYNSNNSEATINPQYSGINTDDIQLGTDYEKLNSKGVTLKFDYIGLYKLTVKSKKKCTLIITNKSGSDNFDIDLQFFDSYFNESLGSNVRQLEIDPSKLDSGYDVYFAFSGDTFDKLVKDGYIYDTYIKIVQTENSSIIKEVPIVRSNYEVGNETETKVNSGIEFHGNSVKVEWNNNVRDFFANVVKEKENAIMISKLEVRISDVTTEKGYSEFTKCSEFSVSHKFDINNYDVDRGYINSFLTITNSKTDPVKHYNMSGDFYPLHVDRSIIIKHEDDVDSLRYSAYLYYYYIPILSINPTSVKLPGESGYSKDVKITSTYLSFSEFREIVTNNLKSRSEYGVTIASKSTLEKIIELYTTENSSSTLDRDNLGNYSICVTINKDKFLYDGSGNLRNNSDQYSDDEILEIVGKSNEVSFSVSREGYTAPPTTYITNVNIYTSPSDIIVADRLIELIAQSEDYNLASDKRIRMDLDGSEVEGLSDTQYLDHFLQNGIGDTSNHTIDIYNAAGSNIGSKVWSANAWSLTSNPSNLIEGYNYVPSNGTVVVNINTKITTGYKYKTNITNNGAVQLFSVDQNSNTITLGNSTRAVVISMSDIFEVDSNATYYDTCSFSLSSKKYETEYKSGNWILADDKDLILTITASRTDGKTPSNQTLVVYRNDNPSNDSENQVSSTSDTNTVSYQFNNTINQTRRQIRFDVYNGLGTNIGIFYIQANAWSLTTNGLAVKKDSFDTLVPSSGSITLTIATTSDFTVSNTSTKYITGKDLTLSNATGPVVLSPEKLYITHVSITGTSNLPIGAARTITVREANSGVEVAATERQLYVYENGSQIASTSNLGDSGLSFSYTAAEDKTDTFYVYNGNQTLGNTDASNHVSYFKLPGNSVLAWPLVTNDVASGTYKDSGYDLPIDFVPKSGNGSVSLGIIVPAGKQLKSSLGKTLSITNCTATLDGTTLTLSNATGKVELSADYFFEDAKSTETETFYSKASIIFSGNSGNIAGIETTITVKASNPNISGDPTNKLIYLFIDDSIVASSNTSELIYKFTESDTNKHKIKVCVGSGNYTTIATSDFQNTSWPLLTDLSGPNSESYDSVSADSSKHIILSIPSSSDKKVSKTKIETLLKSCVTYYNITDSTIELGGAFKEVKIYKSDLYGSVIEASDIEISFNPSGSIPWSISNTRGTITVSANATGVEDKTLSLYEGSSLLGTDSTGVVSYSVNYYSSDIHTYTVKNGNGEAIKTFTHKANAWDLYTSVSSTSTNIKSVPISGTVVITIDTPPSGKKYKNTVSISNTGIHYMNTSVSPATLTLGNATGTVSVLSTDVYEDESATSTYYKSAIYNTLLLSPSKSDIVYADKPSYRVSVTGGQDETPTNKTLILKQESNTGTSNYLEQDNTGSFTYDVTLGSTSEQSLTILNGKLEQIAGPIKLKANVWSLTLNGSGFGTSPGYVSSGSSVTSIDISGITIPSGKEKLSGEIQINNVTAYISGTTLQLSSATGTVIVNASNLYQDKVTTYYTGASVALEGGASSVVGGKTNNFIVTLTPEKVNNTVFQFMINSGSIWTAEGTTSGSNTYTIPYKPTTGTEVVVKVRPGLTSEENCIKTTFPIGSWVVSATEYTSETTCGTGSNDQVVITVSSIPSGKKLNSTPGITNATLVSSSGNTIVIRTATGPVTLSNLFVSSGSSSTSDYYFVDVSYSGPLPDGSGRTSYLIGGEPYTFKYTGLSKAGQDATDRTLNLFVYSGSNELNESHSSSGTIEYSSNLTEKTIRIKITNGLGDEISSQVFTPDAWRLINNSSYVSGYNSTCVPVNGSSTFTITTPSGKAIKSNISIQNCTANISGTTLTLSGATGIVTINDSDIFENSFTPTTETYYTHGILTVPNSVMYAGSSFVVKGTVGYDTDDPPTNKNIYIRLGNYTVGSKSVTPTGKLTSFSISITINKSISSGTYYIKLIAGSPLETTDFGNVLYTSTSTIRVINSSSSGGGNTSYQSTTKMIMAKRIILPGSVTGDFTLVPATGTTRTYQTSGVPISVLGYYSSSNFVHLSNPDINGVWTYRGNLPEGFRYGSSMVIDNLTNYVGVFDSGTSLTTYSSFCLNIKFKSVALRACQDKDSGFTSDDYWNGIDLGTVTPENLGITVANLYKTKEIFSYDSTLGSGFQVDFDGGYQFRKNIYQKNYENTILVGYKELNGSDYKFRLFLGDGLDYTSKWSPGDINVGNRLILDATSETSVKEIIVGSVKISDLNKIRNDSTFVNEISFEPVTISGGNSITITSRTKIVDSLKSPTNRLILGDKNNWNIRDFYGNMCTLVIVKTNE